MRTWMADWNWSFDDLMLSVFSLLWLLVSADVAAVDSGWVVGDVGWMGLVMDRVVVRRQAWMLGCEMVRVWDSFHLLTINESPR